MGYLKGIIYCGVLFIATSLSQGKNVERNDERRPMDTMSHSSDRNYGNEGRDGDHGDYAALHCPPHPERVWSFAWARTMPPYSYVDEDHMKVVGMSIDMMHAVCKAAGRKCEMIFLKDRGACWNPQAGYSPGLMGSWFDGCVNAERDFEKSAVNAFSQSFAYQAETALYMRSNDNVRHEDLTRPNEISMGFLAMTPHNPDCLRRNGIIVNSELVRMYPTRAELREATRSGEVRVAYTLRHDADPNTFRELETPEPLQCFLDGPAVMMRKDNHALLDWLEPALSDFMISEEYGRLCYIWEQISGVPTNCKNMDMNSRGGAQNRD